MVLDFIILILLINMHMMFAVNGKRKKDQQPASRLLYYIEDIVFSIVLLSLLFLLKPSIYYPLNFSAIDKGMNISEEVLTGVIPLFLLPFFLSFTPWSNNYPKDISAAKELFGCPVHYLPNTTKEYLLFVCFIIVGVFFEELLCRQLLFCSLNNTLHLSGDVLVVISSLLFAVGHLYQGWKGMLSNFVFGLLFGKLFLINETLAYPLVLHMFLNLTVAVLAFRRLKDLRKINNKLQGVDTID